jgi:hypothetical protein
MLSLLPLLFQQHVEDAVGGLTAPERGQARARSSAVRMPVCVTASSTFDGRQQALLSGWKRI